ncbi:uncharacterized protein LOC124945999 [Impatiens glandulifera]|uniref:uncharacterized protein LOC124945999 n=1 Tax=Impatiens glandulifera TaxID=253017 RepID=UPI001FB0ADF7|nr:uncharacterized protein LOC124945999 [Impatiens glandulifera]
MGNYLSCTYISPKMRIPKAIRVILPGGEIRQFRQVMKAAEMMVEFPSFFLVNSRSLTIGRRFQPLAADDDLQFGNIYTMFPMRRAHSMVMAADMAVFFMAGNAPAKRILGKVSPETEVVAAPEKEEEVSQPRLSLDGCEGFPMPELKYKLAMCRSRKPMLDTITEEPIRSR